MGFLTNDLQAIGTVTLSGDTLITGAGTIGGTLDVNSDVNFYAGFTVSSGSAVSIGSDTTIEASADLILNRNLTLGISSAVQMLGGDKNGLTTIITGSTGIMDIQNGLISDQTTITNFASGSGTSGTDGQAGTNGTDGQPGTSGTSGTSDAGGYGAGASVSFNSANISNAYGVKTSVGALYTGYYPSGDAGCSTNLSSHASTVADTFNVNILGVDNFTIPTGSRRNFVVGGGSCGPYDEVEWNIPHEVAGWDNICHGWQLNLSPNTLANNIYGCNSFTLDNSTGATYIGFHHQGIDATAANVNEKVVFGSPIVIEDDTVPGNWYSIHVTSGVLTATKIN